MKIIITGRKMEVPDDIRAIVEKKLARLDKFFKEDAVAYVTLFREKNAERLELTVSSCGTLFRAEESDKTFNNALDTVMDVIERQIRKNKTRLGRKLRDGALKTLEANEPEATQEDYIPVRTKTFEVGEMSVEDAIMQMELLGHEFFMFRDTESGKTEVVYKRVNGGYGVLIPDNG